MQYMIVSIPSKSKAHSKLCQMLKMELTEFCQKKFDKVLIKVKNRLKFVKNRMCVTPKTSSKY